MEKRVILAIGLCVAVIDRLDEVLPRAPTDAGNSRADRTGRHAGAGQAHRRRRAVEAVRRRGRRACHQPSRAEGRAGYARRSLCLLQPRRDPAPCGAAQRQVPRPLRRTPPAATIWWRRRTRRRLLCGRPSRSRDSPKPADGSWETRQPAPNTVVFATDTGNVHIEKRFVADTTRYRLHLDVTVTNRRRAAGRSAPGDLAVWPARSGEEGRRLHVGVVGQHGVDALRRR